MTPDEQEQQASDEGGISARITAIHEAYGIPDYRQEWLR